jgi:phospholipid-binding lipoprotein MlaA
MKAALLCCLLAAAIGGCASQGVATRTLPEATPDADDAAVAANAAALAAAAADAAPDAARPNGEEATPRVTPADAPSMQTFDPWERLNRFTYRFNARFDEAVFLPVANGYRRLPSPLRAGVHNFFANLSEVDSVINQFLQWRPGRGLHSLERFVINSTLGIGGLFDVAKKMRLPPQPTGFSATLGTWGVHPGPYLVIPLLGPSTLRDGVGALGDYGASYGVNVADLYRGNKTWALGTVDAVDTRAHVHFRYYASGSPFEYEVVRFLYVRKRLLEDEALHRHRAPRQSAGPAGE